MKRIFIKWCSAVYKDVFKTSELLKTIAGIQKMPVPEFNYDEDDEFL